MFKRIYETIRKAVNRQPSRSIVPVANDYAPKPKTPRVGHKQRFEAAKARANASVRAIYDRGAELTPADYLICHQKGEGRPPKDNLSFTRVGSKVERPLPYSRSFKDLRGVPYTRDDNGTVHRVRD